MVFFHWFEATHSFIGCVEQYQDWKALVVVVLAWNLRGNDESLIVTVVGDGISLGNCSFT